MDKIVIGSVVSTFGVRGDLKIYSLTDFVSLRFKKGSKLFLIDELRNTTREVEVTFSRKQDKFVIVHFKDIDDMTSAEKYKGYSVFMNIDNMHKLKEDEFYHYDLLNCEVYVGDTLLGEVTSIENNGAHDILRVKKKDGKYSLIPFVKSWLINVDIENKKIKIIDMEGI